MSENISLYIVYGDEYIIEWDKLLDKIAYFNRNKIKSENRRQLITLIAKDHTTQQIYKTTA